MNEALLSARELSVGYHGRPLLREICLQVRRGEILTLIGPNGAGKSTILKSLIGQLRLLGGQVSLLGRDMVQLSEREIARSLSVMMTGRAQLERMTCWEVAAAGRYPYTGRLGILGPGDRAAVRAALERVHALDLRDALFDQISDGQRQRVLLARAICQEPEVLVLDEPTSFLDLRGKLELLAILKELVRERRVAVILSLHELDLAQRISDRLLCIRGNGIDRCGTPEEIFSGGYIRQLYGVERGSYCESFGCPELEPVRGKPQVFVIGGNGSGIPVYRRLQRQGVPFAAGILSENDVDHPVASALAAEVIAQRAYHPIGEDTFLRALSVLEGCRQVSPSAARSWSPSGASLRSLSLEETAAGFRFTAGSSGRGFPSLPGSSRRMTWIIR